MECIKYIVFTMVCAARAEFISNFMYRNPSYDNMATLATNVIWTSHFRSVITCASHCTRRHECESMLFNSDTHCCQLLSVNMDVFSDTGPQAYQGWLYYEKKTEELIASTVTTDLQNTEIHSETTQSTPDCSNWSLYAGHWYFWDDTLRTFNESRTFCADLIPRSYIIEVNSESENQWLSDLAAQHCGSPNEYWLNGYDADNSGTFTWRDSDTLTTFTNWLPGEPSDVAGVSAECIVSATGVEGVWLDITCASTRRVVCERDS